MIGRVLRIFGDRVLLDIEGKDIEAFPRGKLRRSGPEMLTGDEVQVVDGMVIEVLPRHNRLPRPAVANVDRTVVVTSLVAPRVPLLDCDRLIVAAVEAGTEALIVLTKGDLLTAEESGEFRHHYGAAGFALFITDRDGHGLDELGERLEGGVAVLAGASGVGKSSLAQRLCGQRLNTAEVSRIGRGRHTTRHAHLLRVGKGFLVDTPGFSSLLLNIPPQSVAIGFPEFDECTCRFSDCRHRHEPGCGVRAAVQAGTVPQARHANYLRILGEAEEGFRAW